MKKLLTLFLLVSLIPLTVYAGQIYGNLQENGRPVQEGTVVVITCGDKQFTGRTNRDGDYRIYVEDKGKCALKVTRNNQQAVFEINSYANPVRYDFDLVIENGRYILRRR